MVCRGASQPFDVVALEARIIFETDDGHEMSGLWRDCLIQLFNCNRGYKLDASAFAR